MTAIAGDCARIPRISGQNGGNPVERYVAAHGLASDDIEQLVHSGKGLVDRYVTAKNRYKNEFAVTKRQNTNHPQYLTSFQGLPEPAKEGQIETVTDISEIAADKLGESPEPNPELLSPGTQLQAIAKFLDPKGPSFQVITWGVRTSYDVEGSTRPACMVHDNSTGKLWHCDNYRWNPRSKEVDFVPGELGRPRAEWIESGIFYQISPFTGKTKSHDQANCVPTENDLFPCESDSRMLSFQTAFTRSMTLMPFPAISAVDTGGAGTHINFACSYGQKPELKDRIGNALQFLGNDNSGFNAVKQTRLGNCGRGKKGAVQVTKWFSSEPSFLAPGHQCSSIDEFLDLIHLAASQHQNEIESEIPALEKAYDTLHQRRLEAKAQIPRKELQKRGKTGQPARKPSGGEKTDNSDRMQERMGVGAAVMGEFRSRLGNGLPKYPGDTPFDINRVPAALIEAVARKFTIHETDPEINRREIVRCLKKICRPPVHPIEGRGQPGKYAHLSDREFDAPLNGDFIGSKFAANDPYWLRQRSNSTFATFAWVSRILSARTRKTRKEKVINEKTGTHRHKTVEVIGRTATAAEILAFLKAFWTTKPQGHTVTMPGTNNEPSERARNAAMTAFAPDYQVESRIESARGVDAIEGLPPLVDNLLSSWRRGAWQESDLDEMLATVHQLLETSRWDPWEWIKEDIYRLEQKFWDFSRLNQCGQFAKNIIRKAIEIIVGKRASVKHRSPFISPVDIYEELARTGDIAQIETTTAEPKKPSPEDTPARALWLQKALKAHEALKKECCLAKIRRGLREMVDVVTEVKTTSKSAKFRLIVLGLNNSNRRTSSIISRNRPTYIACSNVNGACSLETTPKSPEIQNPCIAPVPPIQLENHVIESFTTVRATVIDAEQPLQTQNNAKEVVQVIDSNAATANAGNGLVKTDGELPLSGKTEGRRKGNMVKNKPGRSTYSIKVDSINGNVMLGKTARGKNCTKMVKGYQQRQLSAIATRQEIPVMVKSVSTAKFGRFKVTGLAALTDELASKIPATDVIHGKDGTAFIKVKLFIKPPEGLLQDEKGKFSLQTDDRVQILRVHGQEVVPPWNEKESKSPYWFITGAVETIECVEIGTIFSHWDLVAANKLWNWEASKAAAAKA